MDEDKRSDHRRIAHDPRACLGQQVSRLVRIQVLRAENEAADRHPDDSHQQGDTRHIRKEPVNISEPAGVFQQFESGISVDQVGQVDEQESDETPADQAVQDTRSEAVTEDRLEQADLDDQLAEPLPDQAPIRLALPA